MNDVQLASAPTVPAVAPACRPTPVAQLSSDMRIAVARLARRLRAEKADNELSAGQFSALALIFREGPLTLREVSDVERVTPPSMIRTVATLVEAGYVERRPSASDGRKVLLSVTAHGLELVKRTRQRRDAWLSRRLVNLSPEQRATLAEATAILRELADS